MCCLITRKLRMDLLGLRVKQPPFKLKIKNIRGKRQMRRHPDRTGELELVKYANEIRN